MKVLDRPARPDQTHLTVASAQLLLLGVDSRLDNLVPHFRIQTGFGQLNVLFALLPELEHGRVRDRSVGLVPGVGVVLDVVQHALRLGVLLIGLEQFFVVIALKVFAQPDGLEL